MYSCETEHDAWRGLASPKSRFAHMIPMFQVLFPGFPLNSQLWSKMLT